MIPFYHANGDMVFDRRLTQSDVCCVKGVPNFVLCISGALVNPKEIRWPQVHECPDIWDRLSYLRRALISKNAAVVKCVASSTIWVIGMLWMNIVSTCRLPLNFSPSPPMVNLKRACLLSFLPQIWHDWRMSASALQVCVSRLLG